MHKETKSYILNQLFRKDLESGKFGLGTSLMLSDTVSEIKHLKDLLNVHEGHIQKMMSLLPSFISKLFSKK